MATAATISTSPSGGHDAVDDWRGLGHLVGLATERLTAPVASVHHAITDRWCRITRRGDPRGLSTHRTFIDDIYGAVRTAGFLAEAGLGAGASAIGTHTDVWPVWRSRGGAGIQAAANALWGDEFERRGSPMDTGMGLRDINGDRLDTDTAALAQAFPQHTNQLVVFIHGLGETEHCWADRDPDASGSDDGSWVAKEDAFTPVMVRYNSGRAVSHNGEALAGLISDVVDHWPIEVTDIALVGHSMGGLIARSALSFGASHGHAWTMSAHHLVAIGTPHFGSPVEKAVHLASRVLRVVNEGRPLSDFIDSRSAGIRDMRFGVPSNDGHGSAAMGPTPIRPPTGTVRQHFAAGVVTADNSNPVGKVIGDFVVRVASATGGIAPDDSQGSDVRVFGGINHLGLLHDRAIREQVREWITTSHASDPGGPQ